MNEPLVTVFVEEDMPDEVPYICVKNGDRVVAGVYRCPTCKGEGRLACGEGACPYNINRLHRVHHDPCGDCGGGLVSEKVYQRIVSNQQS